MYTKQDSDSRFGRMIFQQPLKLSKAKLYYQFKITIIESKNPKIYIGVCRGDFNFEDEL